MVVVMFGGEEQLYGMDVFSQAEDTGAMQFPAQCQEKHTLNLTLVLLH